MTGDGNPGSTADILLVDDDTIFLRVLSKILGGYPNQRFATSGQDGLRLARAATPDLILLDIEMPELCGIELLQQLRADPTLSAVPVILITSHRKIPVAVAGFRSGANEFVTKPVSRHKVLSAVQQFLTLPPNSPAERIRRGLWPNIPGIDPAIVRDDIGDDVKLFMTLLHQLVDQFADVATIAARVAPDTIDALSSRMHRLKGASATLGATKLAEVAALAEAVGRGGDLAEFGRIADAAAAELALLKDRIAGAALSASVVGQAGGAAVDTGTPPDRRALARSLRRQSLASLVEFEEREAELAIQLGSATVALVRENLARLQFGRAAELIEGRD